MCARLIELKINGKLYPSTTGIINVGHMDKKYDIRATVTRILAFIELLAASQAIPDHIVRPTEKAYQ